MHHPTPVAPTSVEQEPPAPRRIEPPYYPIVYVRGYAMTHGERAETFHDTYYGFAATSVEKRDAAAPKYFEIDVFEGQFIRLMKLEHYYADATNRGLNASHAHPARSIWICRFYDEDFVREEVRDIIDHAKDLDHLVRKVIPAELKAAGVDLGPRNSDYKVILIAHSMGGLVCRTFIQNILPARKVDPKKLVHRLVTIGTPHRGIDLGRLPDFVENPIVHLSNLFNSEIFKESRMRTYLKLPKGYDVHSLGPVGDAHSFPVKRCLNIIGSDHGSYSAVRHATGAFSDGLVKQDRAYVVAGPRPAEGINRYPDERRAFWANVHRAHSGRRGIVNSYESFENLHRFLFGDIIAEVWLENIRIQLPTGKNISAFYDFEFALTIRGTAVYLHRRQQDPCENAMRFEGEKLPESLHLHTTFMNSGLKVEEGKFSHFAMSLRVIEHRVKDRFLWDRHYPGRPLYEETLEIRVGDLDPDKPGQEVEYRPFHSEKWTELDPTDEPATDQRGPRKVFRAAIGTAAFEADLVVRAGAWPDPVMTED